MNSFCVKSEIRRLLPPYLPFSLCAEGLAVGALVSSGIGLMGAYQDPLQGAEIGVLAVMLALLNGTLNALVCMAVHILSSSISFVMAILYPGFLLLFARRRATESIARLLTLLIHIIGYFEILLQHNHRLL